jgi:flagella basal body P-ring formation protein FlgA
MRAVLFLLVVCCAGLPAAAPAQLLPTGRAQPAPDLVAEAAAKALLTWMSRQGLSGVVLPRSPARAMDGLGGKLRIEARPIAAEQVRHRMMVWVDVWAGESFWRSVPVAVDVELSPAGSFSSVTLRPTADATQAPALESPSGAIEVTRGEWAALRTSAGAVALESRVEVLQDGRAGDRIRVRQHGATGIVLARVVGRGQLELVP